MNIGLLLIRDENDILADILDLNSQWVDCFYALDGSEDWQTARGICTASGKCAGYWRDIECPYPAPPVDGWRQFLYARATEDHGFDHWFLLLHGDELWINDPADAVVRVPDADGFEFRLPFAIPRTWDYGRAAFDQLREFVFPGWPEFRLFLGSPGVYYHPEQHFNTRPQGLHEIVRMDDMPILHFPYRSPESQRLRRSGASEWSPENYAGADTWDDERISELFRSSDHYSYAGIISGL